MPCQALTLSAPADGRIHVTLCWDPRPCQAPSVTTERHQHCRSGLQDCMVSGEAAPGWARTSVFYFPTSCSENCAEPMGAGGMWPLLSGGIGGGQTLPSAWQRGRSCFPGSLWTDAIGEAPRSAPVALSPLFDVLLHSPVHLPCPPPPRPPSTSERKVAWGEVT